MTFFLNLIISIFYCYRIDQIRHARKFTLYGELFLYTPLILLWLFICGGQYAVGTDYFSYLNIFNGEKLDYYSQNGEIAFFYLVKICNILHISGQAIYFIIYSICFYCLFWIICKSRLRYSYCFILLFITVSSLFNNQLNIVRQALTVYIGTCAVLLIFENKKIPAVLLIILSTLFHVSSIIYCVFLIPKKIILNINKAGLLLTIILGIVLSFCSFSGILSWITEYLPPTYAWYIIDDSLGEVSLINSLTKYIFVPFYFLAVINYKRLYLNPINELWFKWGIVGFAFKIAVLNIGLINRLSLGFLIISLFPLYFYIKYLISKKEYVMFSIIFSLLILLYSLKVIVFPIKEYDYHSFFFNF